MAAARLPRRIPVERDFLPWQGTVLQEGVAEESMPEASRVAALVSRGEEWKAAEWLVEVLKVPEFPVDRQRAMEDPRFPPSSSQVAVAEPRLAGRALRLPKPECRRGKAERDA